ncbi:ABC transporter permease [Oerskovia sp. NPDC060287]|uniref:ABC transporter permease n=1 Tax=Oerskovia sp. NPDC060287 TaxID=3347095 RepID=UPI0036537E93
MFVALRDLRFARGRFVLMSTVIVLITFLVGFLASLTAGLARASTSGITDLPVDQLAFTVTGDAKPSFTESQVDATQWDAFAAVDGVDAAEPLGIATTRASVTAGADGEAGTTAAVTAFGSRAGSGLVPDGAEAAPGTVLLSSGAADDLGAQEGDEVALGSLTLTVAGVLDTQADFSHTPVVWMDLSDWQAVGARGGGASGDEVATVVAITGDPSDSALAAAADETGTATLSPMGARAAVSSFSAENMSLTMMQGFLLAISALVVGAFFTVWTINRAGDVAVLKALGASTSYLLRDAIGQALVLLVLGVGVGTALAAGAGALAAQVMPVVVSPATTLLPALILVVLGTVGAVAAIIRITRIDPHAALAAR